MNRLLEYDKRVFDALVGFVEHKDHKGLYVIKIGFSNRVLLRAYLNAITCKLDIKHDAFLQRYGGKGIWDIGYDDLDTHTDRSDGAVALDCYGNLFDDHRAVRMLLPGLVSEHARSGTGHLSMATASLMPGVTTYVCSAEKRRVRTFRKGHMVEGLTYDK